MIRFAQEKDIDRIMRFIDQYWKKGHILGNNKEFFKYEHLFSEGVSYVISINNKGEIDATLGYIPYGLVHRDVMTVIWKANHTANPSLGLELFKFLQENGDVRILASPGSNPKLEGLYRYLGYNFGKMTQWYRLREQNNYKIAKIIDAVIPCGYSNVQYVHFPDWQSVKQQFDFKYYTKNNKPYKESWYLEKRYFNHPIYKYDSYGIKDDSGNIKLMLIFRIININGTNVIRLIDAIGSYVLFENIQNLLDDILNEFRAEYVDCYEVGLPDEYMQNGGWLKTEGSGNVIPNYFSPFLQENVDIYYFSSDSQIVLFKGDGDQDRPN